MDRWPLMEVRLYLATAKKNLKNGKDTIGILLYPDNNLAWLKLTAFGHILKQK